MDRQRPASGWIRVTPAADTRALNNKIIGKEALYRDAITKFQTALISRQGIGLGLFTSGRSSGKPSPGGRAPRSSHARRSPGRATNCSGCVRPCAGRVQLKRLSGALVADSDRERWLPYAEAGELLGITSAAARMLAKRRGWARRMPNAYGDRAHVLVPADAVARSRSRSALNGELHGEQRAPSVAIDMLNMIREMLGEIVAPLSTQLDHERRRTDEAIRQANDAITAERIAPDRATPGPGTAESASDPLTVIGIQTLSQSVEMLHEDLAIANRALVSEREQAERRADELLALLAEG